jgi:hypothetical protein
MKKKLRKKQPGGPVADSTYTPPKPVVKSTAPPKTDAEKKAAFHKGLEDYKSKRVFQPAKPGAEPIVWKNYNGPKPVQKKGGSVKKKK